MFLAALGWCGVLWAGPPPSAPAEEADRLRRQLASSDPAERLFAAATLLERGTPEALKVLEDVLRGTNDRSVRLSVLDAIDKRRDARFIETLMVLLADGDVEVRRRVAASLGGFSDYGVIQRLARLARDPRAAEAAQLGAVEALIQTRQTDAVGVLIDLLLSPHRTVRTSALEALRGLTLEDFGENQRAWAYWWRVNRDRTPLQWDQDLIPKLRRQVQDLKDQLERARRDAIRWAVAFERTLTDPKERAKFLKELLGSEYPELRSHAAQELPKIAGAEGARESLVAALVDADVRVVVAAAGGLAGLGDVQAAPPLRRLVAREEPEVRAAAAGALGRLRAAEAVPDLAKLLDDPEPAVRQAASEALGLMVAREAFDALLGRLSDPSPAVREAAVSAVARFKDARAVQPLVAVLLEDREAPRARFFAARALADFPGREVDDALLKGLGDADAGVRGAAAASLGKRSDPALVDALIGRSLTDESDTVRDEAQASALALIRRAESLPLIDRTSQRLVEAKAYEQAAEVLDTAEALVPTARPEDAGLVATLRRRRAEAFFLAGNWARAAAGFRALYAGGDKTVEGRLVESLEKSGSLRAAAQVHLAALATDPAARAARSAAVIDLAQKAEAADQPREAIFILQSLRRADPTPLAADLEDRLKQAVASAGARFDAQAAAAAPRVRELVRMAAGPDPDGARAAADLIKLDWAAIPALLDALDDADVKVRGAAVTALRAISGTTQTFNAADDEAKRRAAVERWRAWFSQQRTVPGPGSG